MARELSLLTTFFWALTAWSAVHPYDMRDWWLEIATPVAGFVLLAATYRRFRFTSLAYRLMFLEAAVHIVGAHYTHERVPLFDWIAEQMGRSRNDYDRLRPQYLETAKELTLKLDATAEKRAQARKRIEEQLAEGGK